MKKQSLTNKEETFKVLIAEDNAVSARILKKNIEDWGYEVVMAQDGDEAWKAYQNEKIRLAVLDWMMPKINGLDLCKRIREIDHEEGNKEYTYVILLTAKDQQADLIKGFSAGADDYITKPFKRHELKARLKTGKRIIDLQRQIMEQADRDGLTGLWNRKRMFKILEKEINRAQREERPLATIMIDVDNFKKINDTYGHHSGDSVLVEVSSYLQKSIRNYDEICRYGGDELFIILPNCNLAMTERIAERLRQRVSETKIETDTGTLDITISLGGVSSEIFLSDLTPDKLVISSDEALLKAKSNGRNCVVIKKKKDKM
ncbi:MAG: diguanylate cyclase [Candidatus Aminicenantes bacterium]|nr:diguanylate cyclase [Candidatus Aminicenantes bacterium]MDH5383733.1 diguanylate cyclase [Candidatus Aminicenantes bacterium]MDH5742566.1 diguanylate cyclase [Candidatus Aminicenantes bacterium]